MTLGLRSDPDGTAAEVVAVLRSISELEVFA